jgi:hypothetical protein
MWQVDGNACDPQQFAPFEPNEVLYAFDGPRVFTHRDADGELNLAYWSDGDGQLDRYVVVPTTPTVIDLLRTGSISVHEALDQPRCWCLDVTFDGQVGKCRRIDFRSIPPDALPAVGTMLLPTLPPDSTERARRRVEMAVRRPSAAPVAVKLEGRIGQFDWDRMSFDLREINGGKPDQEFVFDPALSDDVLRLAQAQVRVRVAGLLFPGKPIAYASLLSKL